MNPLGIVADDALVGTLRSLAGGRALAGIDAQAHSDVVAVMTVWPKRWGLGSGMAPPTRLRPADLLVVRALACSIDTHEHDPAARQALSGVGTLARLTIDARPYWVPGQVAAGLARTDIPPEGADEVRLPVDCVGVWFGSPLHAGDIEADWMDGHQLHVVDGVPSERVAALSVVPQPGSTVDERVIFGAVLLADDSGHPLDAMIWVVGSRMLGGERDGGWIFQLAPARPSISGQRRLWWSLCAIVAWGDWVEDRPFALRNRHKVRRVMALGVDPSKLGPVRVMDARPREADGTRPEPTTTHASPTTHLRRGHWRRQRVGKGRSTVEMRWIAPAVVNPGHEGDWRETVWTLPPPESIPSTPTPDRPDGRWTT